MHLHPCLMLKNLSLTNCNIHTHSIQSEKNIHFLPITIERKEYARIGDISDNCEYSQINMRKKGSVYKI